MKKRTLIVLLGLFIVIVPVLGLPPSWKNKIIMVSGAAVALMAATKRRGASAPVEIIEERAAGSSSESVSASVPAMTVATKKPRKQRTVRVSVFGKVAEPPSEILNEKDNA